MTTLNTEDKFVAAILTVALANNSEKKDAPAIVADYTSVLRVLARRSAEIEKALSVEPVKRPAKTG